MSDPLVPSILYLKSVYKKTRASRVRALPRTLLHLGSDPVISRRRRLNTIQSLPIRSYIFTQGHYAGTYNCIRGDRDRHRPHWSWCARQHCDTERPR
jgi:hypothetical protein